MDLKTIPASVLPLKELQVPRSLKSPGGGADREQAAVKKVAREFEALFVSLMLKSMRSTVGEDKLTGGGHGEETYRSLLDQEYAAAAAATGTLGLASMLERYLAPAAPAAKAGESADK